MADEEERSKDADDATKSGDKGEAWIGVIELLGWFLEAIVWAVRMIVAAIVALLHGCS